MEEKARTRLMSGLAVEERRLEVDGIGTTAGPKTGCPVIEGALSWLECRTWATYDGGDHTIVVGEVLSLGLGEPADPSALIYHSSHYRELPDA